jgi:hypothetical protein
MELFPLVQIFTVICNTFFEFSSGRPTNNITLLSENNFGAKMENGKGVADEYDYDDYEETFDSLIKGKADNVLDTLMMPPGLRISKETMRIQSETKAPLVIK